MGLKYWGMPAAALVALAWSATGATGARADDSLVGTIKACRLDKVLIQGKIVDRTCNHGCDNRIWSRSLFQKRDLYIYLPPHYDPSQAYPVMIFMHGFASDEQSFLRLAPLIDEAICQGKLPPLIVAAPDGSLDGCGSCKRPGSFFINSNAGPYEDFVLLDVWDYLTHHYAIRPERCAHVLCGVSMGAFGAYSLGIRHRDCFGVVAGIFPPVNLRWQDCVGNPRAEFDPRKWGWRSNFDNDREVVARLGLATIRMGDLLGPVFGSGDAALADIIANNPIELVDRTNLRNGDLEMFMGYGGCDEFNIAAQVESFMYLCKCRGIGLHVVCDGHGRHDIETALRLTPPALEWIGTRLAPYAPYSDFAPTFLPAPVTGRPAMLP